MFTRLILIFSLIGISNLLSADLDISDLSNAANEHIEAVAETLALGGDYKAVHYATPEGFIIGLDIGLEVTAIKIDDDFKDALSIMGNNIDDVPGYIPMPRLNITKGLPLGFDLGFSILKLEQKGIDILNYGGSVKYAILKGENLLPAVAVRATFNKGKYFDKVKTTTYGIEALVSKSLLIIEPFAGIGYHKGKAELNASDFETGYGPPPGLELSPSVSEARFFLGATLKLLFLHIAAQADLGKVKTYSAKLSINL